MRCLSKSCCFCVHIHNPKVHTVTPVKASYVKLEATLRHQGFTFSAEQLSLGYLLHQNVCEVSSKYFLLFSDSSTAFWSPRGPTTNLLKCNVSNGTKPGSYVVTFCTLWFLRYVLYHTQCECNDHLLATPKSARGIYCLDGDATWAVAVGTPFVQTLNPRLVSKLAIFVSLICSSAIFFSSCLFFFLFPKFLSASLVYLNSSNVRLNCWVSHRIHKGLNGSFQAQTLSLIWLNYKLRELMQKTFHQARFRFSQGQFMKTLQI